MTMIQKVMTAQKEITFQEVSIPEINDDQVLLQMSRIGICRNDIHAYHRMNFYILSSNSKSWGIRRNNKDRIKMSKVSIKVKK